MRRNPDYLSEFEQEFELETTMLDNEDNYELENDQESEYNDEFELDSESDSELDSEFEFQEENSYESRLYEILNNNYENELEFENNFNEVLHEMEKDYFFGALKRWVKKKGGITGLLARYAKKLPIVSAANALSSVARGDFRGALKDIASNSLLKTGLSFVPGGSAAVKGLDMANKFLGDSEAPAVPMSKINQMVAVGKSAYDNLARHVVNAQTPQDVKDMGKKAWQQAVNDHRNSTANTTIRDHRTPTNRASRGANQGQKTIIPFPKGSVVIVHSDRVVIRKPY